MNYLIDKNTLEELNKEKGKFIIRFLIAFFLGGGLATILFIFQNPKLPLLFSILIALVLTVMFGYILFVFTEYCIPYKNYKKIVKNSYQSSHISNDVEVIEIKEKSQHYLGIEIRVVAVKEIDEGKELYVYIPVDKDNPLEVNKKYVVETYHSFLIGYVEK